MNYTFYLKRLNFIEWMDKIASTDSDKAVRKAASEISYEVKGNSAVVYKPYYEKLFLKYKFKVIPMFMGDGLKLCLYSYDGFDQKIIGIIQGLITGSDQRCCVFIKPVPSVTPSLSLLPSITPSVSIQPTISPSVSIQPTITPSLSVQTTPSGTPAESPGVTPSGTPAESPGVTPSGTPAESPGVTPSGTPAESPGVTPSGTPAESPGVTPSGTPAESPGVTPSGTPVESPGVTPSGTPDASPMETPSVTPPVVTPSITMSNLPPEPSYPIVETPPIVSEGACGCNNPDCYSICDALLGIGVGGSIGIDLNYLTCVGFLPGPGEYCWDNCGGISPPYKFVYVNIVCFNVYPTRCIAIYERTGVCDTPPPSEPAPSPSAGGGFTGNPPTPSASIPENTGDPIP